MTEQQAIERIEDAMYRAASPRTGYSGSHARLAKAAWNEIKPMLQEEYGRGYMEAKRGMEDARRDNEPGND